MAYLPYPISFCYTWFKKSHELNFLNNISALNVTVRHLIQKLGHAADLSSEKLKAIFHTTLHHCLYYTSVLSHQINDTEVSLQTSVMYPCYQELQIGDYPV